MDKTYNNNIEKLILVKLIICTAILIPCQTNPFDATIWVRRFV